MDDSLYASIFFLIFAIALVLYSAALIATGDKSLLPLRAQHSISGPDDVKLVGRVTRTVALVIGAVAIVLIIVSIVV